MKTLLLILVFSFAGFAQTSTVKFEKVALSNIGSILIPSNLELQAGLYKELSNNFSKQLGVDVSGNIIFQQKGQNEFPVKPNSYARLMIKETVGKPKDYRKITTKITLSRKQLGTFDSEAKGTLIKEFQKSNIGLKLLKWDGVSLSNINGRDVMKTAYLRQLGDNPPVYVELYHIENFDRKYLLTISYRQEDANIWKDVLETAKNSFTIMNIK